MFMWHAKAGDWKLGLHTSSFFGYDGASSCGADDLISINWLMGMASRTVGRGDLTLRAMLSAEPATMPENGYPLLLQTGESFSPPPSDIASRRWAIHSRRSAITGSTRLTSRLAS